ncbi:Fic family protein [Mucilaginibacter sp. BJC16-A38]|uniref:Fic family protein n=1 Tax=Mucilaginibacter phenanthrenivorans TaxID=1234842 RepID=UPI002157D427|nr:Fic family protein [Mucilaginibacter phenanthrenivorans]MCR8561109.1 Fic family protein [Mucilaginibacter phenanthrenivorans]
MEVIKLLSDADRQLGRLDMFSKYIPNLEMFIQMHVAKEATLSSKIEGTKTSIEDAMMEKADIALSQVDDWIEVQNYIAAMNYGVGRLHDLPFSSRLIKETHAILLKGSRGDKKHPGSFRTSQNWIGGATINDAKFIPPVHTSIADLMSDLEKFAHNEIVYFPELLKIALIHYQFETIHPFLDGNGRVGRLFITLYLVGKGILKQPILYLSDFLEKNRTHYYDNLMSVREHNNINQWLKFFLVGVIETANKSIDTFDKILQLQKQTELKINTLGSRAANAQKLMTHLYQKPIVNTAVIGKTTGISGASAYKLAKDMVRLGIIKETTGLQRGKTYVFEDYLNLFR